MLSVSEEELARYFPYKKWRPGQLELAKRVFRAISEYEVLLVAYPVGAGKTAAALAAALASNAEKIVYVARTKSQFQAPLREVKRLEKIGIEIDTVVVRSKQDYCPLKFSKNVDYREFLALCSKLRAGGNCPYSAQLTDKKLENIDSTGIVSIRRAWKTGKLLGVCPYEIMLNVARKARLLITSYPYIFSPSLRTILVEKSKIPLHSSVLILDEAHNIVDLISGIASTSLPTSYLREARRELKNLPPDLSSSIGKRLSMIYTLIKKESESQGEIDVEKLSSLLPSREDLAKAIWYIEKNSGLYISRLHRLIEVVNLVESYSGSIVAYTTREGGEAILRIELYDTSRISGEVLSQAQAVILLSATMPPKEYLVEMLGIRHRKVCEAVYPYLWGGHADINLVTGISTRYTERTERLYKRYGALITLLTPIKGLTLVITPSYTFMQSLYKYVKLKPVFIEKKSSEIETLEQKVIKALKKSGRAVLLATAWGKLVEGIEFTGSKGSLIDTIIVAGLPVAEPNLKNKRLFEKLSQRLGTREEAWKMVYIYPAVFKVVQAIGRGLRSENDRVKAYIIDDRAPKYVLRYLEKYGFSPSVLSLKELLARLGYS